MFQFQIGAIKSGLNMSTVLTIVISFQFQIGAIKSCLVVGVWNVPFLFQFQIGAIKREISKITIADVFKVSIPNWCD